MVVAVAFPLGGTEKEKKKKTKKKKRTHIYAPTHPLISTGTF